MRLRAAALIGTRFGGGLFAPLLPVSGIALGVALLIASLSLMNGFESAFRERILGLTPHLLVYPREGGQFEAMETALRRYAGDTEAIESLGLFVQLEGAVRFSGSNRPAILHGIDPAEQTDARLLAAYLPQDTPPETLRPGEILPGSILARGLGVTAGQSLAVLFPGPGGAGSRLQSARFRVRAIFDSGTELDRGLVFTHRETALQWAERLGAPVALRLRLSRPEFAPRLARILENTLPVPVHTRNWTVAQGNLFAAVQMSRRLIAILMLAVLLVASFNIVAALLLMIDQRRGEIALLGVLGTSRATLLCGILLRGLLLGCSGVLLGLLAGVLLSLVLEDLLRGVQTLLGIQLLSREAYFLNYLPVEIVPQDLLRIALLALVLCLVAALYPAWRAAGIRPLHALRWE